MEEQNLFDEGGVLVTRTKLSYENKYYQLSSIKSVLFIKEPFDVKGLLINLLVAIAGLYGILTFSTIGLILGLIGLGIGGFNLKGFYQDFTDPVYIVCVDLHSGETIYIKRRNLDFAKRLTDILNSVLRMD
ncbi:MAG: DUF6232 family protein [Ignavibacteriales bacterium]|nr:DUF6232 family protein [Ignavibacteriales bacterium]